MLHTLQFALGVTLLASSAMSYHTTETFISDFLQFQKQAAPPAAVGAFVCWRQEYSRQLMMNFSGRFILLSVLPPSRHTLARLQATEIDVYVTFVLDMGCQDAPALLQEASKLQMLRKQYRWLLLGSHYTLFSHGERFASPQPPISMTGSRNMSETVGLVSVVPADDDNSTQTDVTDAILGSLNILLDSDVTIGRRVSENTFLLLEVYRRGASEGLVKKRIGDWRKGRGVRLAASPVISVRRINLHKTLLKAVMVVTHNSTMDHLDDNVDKHIDTYTKTNYAQFKCVTEILNVSVDMTITDTWGYAINGSWTGLTGFLQRGEADIGSTGMFVLKQRLSVVNFIAATTPTRSAFLFRPPPLSFVMNIFTLPFSRAVWLASAALIALTSLLLYSAFRWEYCGTADEQGTANWSDVLLLSLGAVCQQGSTLEARGVAGRTISIMLYVTVIFLYTSYSACIVALLQSTTNSIRTLEDLYHSGIALGAIDVVYSRHFFSTASDPLRRAIYTQKVSPPGGHSNFMSLQQGLERVRKGFFAFHHELGPGYKIISDTFLEEEKCGLQTITCFVDFVDPWVSVSKHTPYKEVLSLAYRTIHERGLQMRENLRYYHKKPECGGQGSSFISVGIVDCYPALLVLLYGLLISVVVLLLEVQVHKRFRDHSGPQTENSESKKGDLKNIQNIPYTFSTSE